MKVLIIFLISFCFLQSQTYKVDMGGTPNQYPTQIEVVDGDVIIATTENFGKGYGIDAVSLINVTNNKVFRVENSKRQVNPRILIDNNKILFSHWELHGIDAGQLMLLDKDFNVLSKTQLNYNGDTEIYFLTKFNNDYFLGGDINLNTLFLKFDNQLKEINKLSFSTPNANYSYLTYATNLNTSILATYTTNFGKFGIINLNSNMNIIDKKTFLDQSRTKFPTTLEYLNNNYLILCDNNIVNFNGFINSSILVLDRNYNIVSEKIISVNNSELKINKLKVINNIIYFLGYYFEAGKRKSVIGSLDNNYNITFCYNNTDFDIFHDINYFTNQFYLLETKNNIDDYNGELYYSKINNLSNICNMVDIKTKTKVTEAGFQITNIQDNFDNKVVNNLGYSQPSYSILSSKTNEICKLATPTSIQGIINKYIDVLEIDTCENKIKVSPTNEYSVDDYVLMIQMQGAIIDTTNTPKYGDLIDLGSCGLYEFGYISKIDKVTDGSWITFKNKIVNSYDVKGSVQLVGVPIYGNANVVGDIIGKPWDGKSGGVIIVKATDTLNLSSGNIDASGIGFRGGKHSTLSEDRGIQNYFTSNSRFAGEKGEGIYKVKNNIFRYGRGKSANGGGGGNAHNGGGGGGSNLYFINDNSFKKIGGLGGYAIGGWSALGGDGGHLKILDTLKFNRLILGGGGGGGHTNETNNGDGGSGGGIIIVDSPFIENTYNTLKSNGVTAGNAFVDGGGGGGAGGTICLKNRNIYNKLSIIVDGGNGGDSQKGIHLGGASGGGGTSGRIYLIGNLKVKEYDLSFLKGIKGYTDNGGVTGFYPGYDADDNDYMITNIDIIDNLLQQNQPLDSLESIGTYQKTFSLCDSSKVTLTAPTTNSKYTYKWDTGETGIKIQVTKAGKFKCIISYGCKSYAAEFEVTDNQIQYNLTTVNFENMCGLDSVQVSVSFNSTNTSIVWFDGSNSKTRTFTKNGKYKYTLKLSGFCDLVSEVDIQEISSGGNTSLLSITPDTLLFSNSDIDKLTCQTFTLTNVGVDTVNLSELNYLKKLNFSTPNSIFPITLYPKESRDLEICFYGNKFKTNYSDSIRFDNCNNPKFLTLLADIPEDTLSFATRCMFNFDAAAPSKSIVMSKTQLNELVQNLQSYYKLSNLLGLELSDVNAILPNQLVYIESNSIQMRILVIE